MRVHAAVTFIRYHAFIFSLADMASLGLSIDPGKVISPLFTRPARIISVVAGVWAGAWGTYYLLRELKRCTTLAKRRRKYPLPKRHGDESQWFGHVTSEERKNIVSHFSSMKFCGRYLNVTPEWREQGIWEWMWWKLVDSVLWNKVFGFDGGLSHDLKDPKGRAHLEAVLPVHPLDTKQLWGTSRDTSTPSNLDKPAAFESGASYTWLGQSTCLVQMHGVTILTDPVFGDQPIPSIFSPNRMRPMPCTIHDLVDLGTIDIVLVSHNHFDHLDLSIVPKLSEHVQWIVPTGVGYLLEQRGVAPTHISELGWWDETVWQHTVHVRTATSTTREAKRRLDVAAVPASHWSARSLWDVNRSLWNSYVVRCGARGRRTISLFFCGDSGYSPSLFSAIGRMYGPFDVAAIPIGSYEPRWHLSLQHMDPHGAVCVAKDIGARSSFGMHWGTWCMSDERWDAPLHDLATALQAEGKSSKFLRTVAMGATHVLSV